MIQRYINCISFQDGLMRFGYVGDEAFNSLREIGYEEWKRAVMKFQKFARIPVTGLMDVQTLQLLQRKRCGLPDISWSHLSAIHDERHRSKRYALQGSKWPRNNLTWRLVLSLFWSLTNSYNTF